MSESVEGEFLEVWECGGSINEAPCQSTNFRLTREGFVFCNQCGGRQKMRWRFEDLDGEQQNKKGLM